MSLHETTENSVDPQENFEEPSYWNTAFEPKFDLRLYHYEGWSDAQYTENYERWKTAFIEQAEKIQSNRGIENSNLKIRFDDKKKCIEIGYSYEFFFDLFKDSPLSQELLPIYRGPYNYTNKYGDYAVTATLAQHGRRLILGDKTIQLENNEEFQRQVSESQSSQILFNKPSLSTDEISTDQFITTLVDRAAKNNTPLRLLIGVKTTPRELFSAENIKAKDLLIHSISKLKKDTVLGLRGLPYETLQTEINEWLKSPEKVMDPELSYYVDKLGYREIFNAAKEHKDLRILALDTEFSLNTANTKPKDLNHISLNIIQAELKPEENFIAWIDEAQTRDINTNGQLEKGLASLMEQTLSILVEGTKFQEQILSQAMHKEASADFVLQLDVSELTDKGIYNHKGQLICPNRYDPAFRNKVSEFVSKFQTQPGPSPDSNLRVTFHDKIPKDLPKEDIITRIFELADEQDKPLQLLDGESHSDDSGRQAAKKALESGRVKTLALENVDNKYQKLLHDWINDEPSALMPEKLRRFIQDLDLKVGNQSNNGTFEEILNVAKKKQVQVILIDSSALKVSQDFPDEGLNDRGNNMNFVATEVINHYRTNYPDSYDMDRLLILAGSAHITNVYNSSNQVVSVGLNRPFPSSISVSYSGPKSFQGGGNFKYDQRNSWNSEDPLTGKQSQYMIRPDILVTSAPQRTIEEPQFSKTNNDNAEEYTEIDSYDPHRSSSKHADALIKDFLKRNSYTADDMKTRTEELLRSKVKGSEKKTYLDAAQRLHRSVSKKSFFFSRKQEKIKKIAIRDEILRTLNGIIEKQQHLQPEMLHVESNTNMITPKNDQNQYANDYKRDRVTTSKDSSSSPLKTPGLSVEHLIKKNVQDRIKAFSKATFKLLNNNGKTSKWIPDLKTLKQNPDGNYDLTLVHKDTSETVNTTTPDKTFEQTKHIIEKYSKTLISDSTRHRNSRESALKTPTTGFFIMAYELFHGTTLDFQKSDIKYQNKSSERSGPRR